MRHGLLTAVAAGALLGAGAARADTLPEALVRTYNSNPTITSERAQLRAIDEDVAIARSLGRPLLSGTGSFDQGVVSSGAGGNGRNVSAGANLSFPLFTAGRIGNSIRAADERVLAGRQGLRAIQGDVFTEAVAAYMDVIRDRAIVALNRNQVEVLDTNLLASRDRFEVGDLTRTDVAQSEARLAIQRSNLELAEGRLVASEENYRRVIGISPDALEPPPPLPPFPATADAAVEVGLADNPDLAAIAAQIRAAGLDVRVARSSRLPSLSAVASGRYTNFLGTADEQFGAGASNSQSSLGVGLGANIPLYQGGLVGARVRQAQAFQSQLLEQGVAIERAIVASVRASFSTYDAATSAIASNEIAVSANSLALEGTRAEQSVGTRNILDVLNAEQELLNAQVLLVTARRDAYVAGFSLLNAMGRAEVDDLNLDGGYIYDPVLNYDRVSRRASDWADDPEPAPVATRTAPIGPPSPIAPVTAPRR